jgi:hypothetical protein
MAIRVAKPTAAGIKATASSAQAHPETLTLDHLRQALQTPDAARLCRESFRALPFSHQARLIGEYAKEQLRLADELIVGQYRGKLAVRPNALKVWTEMSLTDIPAYDNMQIIEQFPNLRNLAPRLSELFIDCYAFWADNFYACDQDGKPNSKRAEASAARHFSDPEFKTIAEESGMIFLGQMIRDLTEFQSTLPEED